MTHVVLDDKRSRVVLVTGYLSQSWEKNEQPVS